MRSLRTSLTTAATLAAVALTASPAAAASGGEVERAPGTPRVVTVTPRDGVRLIGDLRVGPPGSPRAVSTLAGVRDAWGRERRLVRRRCTASWGTGVKLLFASFGGPSSCARRFVQVAYVVGKRWSVKVGRKTYEIGDPRSVIPRRARRIARWNGGGYQLASLPFAGSRTLSVMAHVSRRGRIDRFVLFIGAAGD